jgi:hypothetical protein
VQTVLGPVEAGQLGRVLMRQHLLCLLPGPWPYGGPRGPEALDEEPAAFAVSALRLLATRPPHPEWCSVSGPPGMGCAGMIPLSWWHAEA